MGLDMFLIRHKKIEENNPMPHLKRDSTTEDKENYRIRIAVWKKSVDWVEEYAYWRKFYALHNYFCFHAKRDIACDPFKLSLDIVEDLLHRLKTVKECPFLADKVFPANNSFIDEIYIKAIEDSIKIFENVYIDMVVKNYEFEYDAW